MSVHYAITNITNNVVSTYHTSAEEDINDDIYQDGEHLLDNVSNNTSILNAEYDHTTHNVSSLESDNLYRHCKEEDHKDNTHEYGIDRSMYECKNIAIVTMVGSILKCNDSPKKSDGRGVSAERFKRYASNLVGLKRYLALVGIKRNHL